MSSFIFALSPGFYGSVLDSSLVGVGRSVHTQQSFVNTRSLAVTLSGDIQIVLYWLAFKLLQGTVLADLGVGCAGL